MSFGRGKNKKSAGDVPQTTGADKPERISNKLDRVVVTESNPVRLAGIKRILKYKYAKLAGVAAIVLIGASAFWLLKGEKADVAICRGDMIIRYNAAVKSEGEAFAKNLKDTATRIESIEGYDDDMSCVFMVYFHYAHVRDADNSRKQLDRLKELDSDGHKIHESIMGQASIEQLEGYVKSLEFNRDLKGKGDGSG